MYSKELIKGTLRTIILNLLSENGRMYGYEITQTVKRSTNEKIVLTEGALYPTLHKLQAENLIISETENINGRTRKYYSVTETGQAHGMIKSQEFSDFVKTMSTLLNSKLTTDE